MKSIARGKTVKRAGGSEAKVRQRCKQDLGHWYCETHGMSFHDNNQLAKHVKGETIPPGGDCEVVLYCPIHGAEAASPRNTKLKPHG